MLSKAQEARRTLVRWKQDGVKAVSEYDAQGTGNSPAHCEATR